MSNKGISGACYIKVDGEQLSLKWLADMSCEFCCSRGSDGVDGRCRFL